MSKRSSEQRRMSVLRKLEGSGLSAAEFCRRRGLCYGTVMGWRRRAGGAGAPKYVKVNGIGGVQDIRDQIIGALEGL